jgi:hypothetical protein
MCTESHIQIRCRIPQLPTSGCALQARRLRCALSYFGRCRVAINLGCQVLKEFLNSIKISKQLTEFWKNYHNFTKSLSGLKNSRKVRKL